LNGKKQREHCEFMNESSSTAEGKKS
jgi:hypothetical protein